ncbi:MAG TPA: DUF222 domain-containing protein [Candidatus Limnocylindrales bacterium]|nr:DUF222 domain-containing protein [Candidatus Limnocylindrales bacterium]
MTSTIHDQQALVDPRAVGALPQASADVVAVWDRATSCAAAALPAMGLLAGDRPTADVEVLAGAFAAVEYELARRMHAATTAGSLPLVGPGAVLAARGWASPQARRLARTGALAAAHPSVAAAWAAGIITSDHVDAVARNVGPLTEEQLAAVIAELGTRWGQWSPPMITRLVLSAIRLLHPPADDRPTGDEADAHATRDLSFALLGDTVILSGSLPRLEGEAVIAAIDALAERLRSTADHVPAGARRADALVELVNSAATSGALPTRGGLPVALTVTLEHTRLGDPVWTTSRGHLLTPSEQRFTACDPTLTPIAVTTPGEQFPDLAPDGLGARCPDTLEGLFDTEGAGPMPGIALMSVDAPAPHPAPEAAPAPTAADRIAALAALLFDGPRIPLAVGRTSRTATPAQRKALAARDGGCIIPGCRIPAENCQSHHVQDWAAGGPSDIDNLALLCWTHHRQVDLTMWTIEPAEPGTVIVEPPPGAPPGTPWPGNNGSPWIIRAQHRTRWRL